jgi:hypothetical protein
MDKSKMIIDKPSLEGQIGESHLWDGPLDTSGFPMGKGSSSGKNGMEIKKYPCNRMTGMPITEIAKMKS